MTLTLHSILLLLSLLCFLGATIGVEVRRVSLVPLGLAFFVLTFLV